MMRVGNGTREVDCQVPGLGNGRIVVPLPRRGREGRRAGGVEKKVNLTLNVCSRNKIAMPLAHKCCRVVIVADGH